MDETLVKNTEGSFFLISNLFLFVTMENLIMILTFSQFAARKKYSFFLLITINFIDEEQGRVQTF